MRLLMLFGGTADRLVYGPLFDELKKTYKTKCHLCCPLRRPDSFLEILQKNDFDLVIAGSGVSPHLPSLAAAKTSKPVIGIPVDLAFGGLGTLMSILQAPFSIPIMSTPPGEGSMLIIPFLQKWRKLELNPATLNFSIVVREELMSAAFVRKEIEKCRQLLNLFQKNIPLHIRDEASPDSLNMILVNDRIDVGVDEDPLCLHVPLFSPKDTNHHRTFTKIYDWVKSGGLWCGVNSPRNALLFWLRLFDHPGDYRFTFQQVKEGK